MFHWTDKRILGHLILCFISYLCEAYLSKKFHEKGIMLKDRSVQDKTIKPRLLSPLEAMRQLKEVRAIPVKVKGQTLWIRTDITGNVTCDLILVFPSPYS